MSEFTQCLFVLCVFLAFIFTVYISYKMKLKFESAKDNKEMTKEIKVDMDIQKKE